MVTNKQTMVWLIAGSLATLGTVGALAQTGILGVDTVVKADSFDDKHLRYEYVVELEAEGTKTDVNVSVEKVTHKVITAAGKETSSSVLKNQEVADPACGSPCFTAWVTIYAHSEPGCTTGGTYPRINWVEWNFFTPIKLGGEGEIEFVAKIPGCFGKSTLTTKPYVMRHQACIWGWCSSVTAEDPVVTVFDVVKA